MVKQVRFRYRLADLEKSKKVITHSEDYITTMMHCPLYRKGKKVGELIHNKDHRVNDDGSIFTVGTSTIKLANYILIYHMAYESSSHLHEGEHSSKVHTVIRHGAHSKAAGSPPYNPLVNDTSPPTLKNGPKSGNLTLTPPPPLPSLVDL